MALRPNAPRKFADAAAQEAMRRMMTREREGGGGRMESMSCKVQLTAAAHRLFGPRSNLKTKLVEEQKEEVVVVLVVVVLVVLVLVVVVEQEEEEEKEE